MGHRACCRWRTRRGALYSSGAAHGHFSAVSHDLIKKSIRLTITEKGELKSLALPPLLLLCVLVCLAFIRPIMSQRWSHSPSVLRQAVSPGNFAGDILEADERRRSSLRAWFVELSSLPPTSLLQVHLIGHPRGLVGLESPEGIGTLGMIINFAVAIPVALLTAPPALRFRRWLTVFGCPSTIELASMRMHSWTLSKTRRHSSHDRRCSSQRGYSRYWCWRRDGSRLARSIAHERACAGGDFPAVVAIDLRELSDPCKELCDESFAGDVTDGALLSRLSRSIKSRRSTTSLRYFRLDRSTSPKRRMKSMSVAPLIFCASPSKKLDQMVSQ